MANFFEVQNGIINDVYNVSEPKPNINHIGLFEEGITWLKQSGDFQSGDLYDGETLSYGAKTLAKAREWRNNELKQTDFIMTLTDYPNRDAWITYRQELRDWTATEDFPNTKPTKP